MLTISIVEMTVIIRLMISTVDVEVIKEIKKGYAVSRRIRSNERHHFYSNYSYICRNTSAEIIRTALTHRSQNKTNSLEGMFECLNECGMNVYNAGVIHCDHIPYNACFTGIYCIIPLFLLFR